MYSRINCSWHFFREEPYKNSIVKRARGEQFLDGSSSHRLLWCQQVVDTLVVWQTCECLRPSVRMPKGVYPPSQKIIFLMNFSQQFCYIKEASVLPSTWSNQVALRNRNYTELKRKPRSNPQFIKSAKESNKEKTLRLL